MGDFFEGGYTYDPRAWQTWSVTGEGPISPYHHRYNPDTSSFTIDIPRIYPPYELDAETLKKFEKEGPKMKTDVYQDPHSVGRRYAVACSHEPDLSQDRILRSISMMKSKLMMQCAPVKVENIECKMTPAVKNNIVMAYKKLAMYGKKTPFVARFDEYGRRLPDEIKIDTMKGMTIKIVDPVEYGPCYLSFEGIVRDLFTRDYTYVDSTESPF